MLKKILFSLIIFSLFSQCYGKENKNEKPSGSKNCPQTLPPKMSCVEGGIFKLGSNLKDFSKESNELSSFEEHEVELSTFLIDQYEVTNEEYQICVKEKKCRFTTSDYPHMRNNKQPILKANWFDAHDYCKFAGKRLPTEAEFEAASRGKEALMHPWGNEIATCQKAVIQDKTGRGCLGDKSKGSVNVPPNLREKGSTWEVGSKGAYLYNLYDMAGNAQEWVSDWFSPNLKKCGIDCTKKDPKGPCNGEKICKGHTQKLVKGGSWYWGPISARAATRRPYWPQNQPAHNFGFRCAKDLP